jgi:hypothetical protein
MSCLPCGSRQHWVLQAVPGHVESVVIAGLDPAIHSLPQEEQSILFRKKKMDERVKFNPAHDGGGAVQFEWDPL